MNFARHTYENGDQIVLRLDEVDERLSRRNHFEMRGILDSFFSSADSQWYVLVEPLKVIGMKDIFDAITMRDGIPAGPHEGPDLFAVQASGEYERFLRGVPTLDEIEAPLLLLKDLREFLLDLCARGVLGDDSSPSLNQALIHVTRIDNALA